MMNEQQPRYRDINPSFVERTSEGTRSWDTFSKLFESRIIMIVAPLDAATAATVISELLVLQQVDAESPINIYINSPGGDYESAIAIYDTMKFITNPIHVTCIGEAQGVAALILAGGDLRLALPHARITLYTLEMGGERGQATDIRGRADLIAKKVGIYNEIIANETGHTVEEVEIHLSRHKHLLVNDAIEYGILDKVAPPNKKARNAGGV